MGRRHRALLLTSALVIAACGGSDDDADEPATVEEANESPATTESAAPPTTEAADDEPTNEPADEPATEPAATTEPAPTTTTIVPDPPFPAAPTDAAPTNDALSGYAWTEVAADSPWEARAGLRVVELDGRLLLLGGRTPNQSEIPGDSRIWADVWASDDGGATWEQLLTGTEPDLWAPRAYFQSVVKDGYVYVIGGQDFGLEENPFCALLEQGLEPPPGLGIDPDAPCPEFLPTSNFFNDVWRSADGVAWEQMTERAPWTGRAGLMAAALGDHIYVFGGSTNDDTAIIGPSGPARIYYDDVWRSTDGAEWELRTEDAPWEPRAGGAAIVRDDVLYLFGGEDGFTCDPLPDCDPPYFNDVWSTTGGSDWTLVTESAGWSPRPGHVCELVGNRFVCFGGFGLIENPTDVWVSLDGADWTELAAPPWASDDPTAMKYDFDALTYTGADGIERVLTFGGDRETFDFADPENYLRIDDDVWSFAPPT